MQLFGHSVGARAPIAAALLASLVSTPATAQTELGVPSPMLSVSPTGVNLFSGSYHYSNVDLSVGDLQLVRSYAGGEATRSKFFGQRWSHNFDMYVYERQASAQERYAHVMIDGRTYSYNYNGLTPTIETESYNYLSFANNKYSFVDREGSLYTFAQVAGNPRGSSSWSVESVAYPTGKRLTFQYDGSGKLKAVTSNAGYAFVFTYGTNGYVSEACAYNLATVYVSAATTCTAASLRASYGYSGIGSSALLASATNVVGRTQYISYASNRPGYVSCVTDFDSAACPIENIYDGGATGGTWPYGFVTRQNLSNGGIYQYSYTRSLPDTYADILPWEPWVDGDTRMTDPAGNQTYIAYDRSRPVSWSNSEGQGETFEYYWQYADPSKIIAKEGNYTSYNPGASYWTEKRLRDKANNSANDLVATASYPVGCNAFTSKRCFKPDYVIDFRGNRIDYTYHDETGNIAVETGPPVNGVRPQKRYTYQQRYAGVKNSSNVIVAAGTPVWLLVEESQCRTQASCAGTADEVRVTYEYGASGTANALRLRAMVVAADGVSRRTCYGYDDQGNRISETTPQAALAVCP